MNLIRILKARKGFTLLELMTVVFIIAILAAVAIPLVNRYLLKSKTAEAGLNLRKIYDGEVAYYHDERVTGSGLVITKRFIAANPTPAGTPTKNKRSGNWETGGWPFLKFSTDSPVLYQYYVVTAGIGIASKFTARAEGDIDGDTKTSLFERVGSVDPISGEPQGGGAVFELDPLE